MSAPDRVRLDLDGDVAEVALVRAAEGNAIDPAMVDAFDAAVTEVAERVDRGEVRAVLVRAEGRAFTVGGDLRHFLATLDDLGGELDAMIGTFHETLPRLASLPAPVVTAVGGPIAGGGLGLAWVADLVVCSPQGRFATGFHKLGLSGDGGSSWWLPRLVGMRRAQKMIVGGRVLDAETALEWGLVTEIVPEDELLARARTLAGELAAGPPRAYAEMRALLRASWDRSMEDGYAAEREAMSRTGRTADAREGITAFSERRAPRFTGGVSE